MKLFRKNQIDIQKEILEELKEIHSIIEDEQRENRDLNWLLISQDEDIKKLKERNKELKKLLKEVEK
jgi:septal ring factor EnvC (AmiA/AmiB activator)